MCQIKFCLYSKVMAGIMGGKHKCIACMISSIPPGIGQNSKVERRPDRVAEHPCQPALVDFCNGISIKAVRDGINLNEYIPLFVGKADGDIELALFTATRQEDHSNNKKEYKRDERFHCWGF